ncbi:CHAD domain-containing protein [Streptomyces varsoviensis]|nr:CHAD domain-containing protein [Streptomyces varsoviensis]
MVNYAVGTAVPGGGASGGGGPTAADVLCRYLNARAADFLRSLRLHSESGADADDAAEAARLLRRSARRISGALYVYRPLTDTEWADQLRAELAWLSGTLAREHAYAARLARLRGALHRLSGAGGQAGPAGERDCGRAPEGERPAAALTVGAARAGALLERQLTLARTRAHSAALQSLGSSRFHAVADAVAVLASEVPLDPAAEDLLAHQALPRLAEHAHQRLVEAVRALPLGLAGHPYNAEALVHGLAATETADAPPAAERQDAPWHHVRELVRLRRYAQEVLDVGEVWDVRDVRDVRDVGAPGGGGPGSGDGEGEPGFAVRLLGASQALDRHRDAAEAAAAAASAARTPRIAPATAYALGVLHADQRHEVEAARFSFGRIWQRLAAAPARTAP